MLHELLGSGRKSAMQHQRKQLRWLHSAVKPAVYGTGDSDGRATCVAAVTRCLHAGTVGPQLTLSNLGGTEALAATLQELIVLPLTKPGLFCQFGLTPPGGVLLHGPPGTGKTALARAAAAEAQATLMVRGAELLHLFHA